MGIIAWVVFGALAGWVAGKLAKTDDNAGCLTNIVVGVVGAFLGGAVFSLITGRDWNFEFDLASFVVAVGGSVVLLLVLQRVRR